MQRGAPPALDRSPVPAPAGTQTWPDWTVPPPPHSRLPAGQPRPGSARCSSQLWSGTSLQSRSWGEGSSGLRVDPRVCGDARSPALVLVDEGNGGTCIGRCVRRYSKGGQWVASTDVPLLSCMDVKVSPHFRWLPSGNIMCTPPNG